MIWLILDGVGEGGGVTHVCEGKSAGACSECMSICRQRGKQWKVMLYASQHAILRTTAVSA